MDHHDGDNTLDNAAEELSTDAAEELRRRGPAHMDSYDDDDDDSEEEEEECRVCRGPAEEGQPLFKPCKCSGSIGLTHQDCLTSWLGVTRGGGRCELCAHKFRFAPKYAEGAPARLPPSEVLLGLTRRAAVRWLPLALRVLLAAFLWLVALPLATAYLYQGWMRRPSSVSGRWKWELVPGDAVSGAVVAAVVVLSFLSLMSFADFLRFNWQQNIEEEAAAGGEAAAEGQARRDAAGREAAPLGAAVGPGQVGPPDEGGGEDFPPAGEGVDNGFLEHDDEHRAGPPAAARRRTADRRAGADDEPEHDDDGAPGDRTADGARRTDGAAQLPLLDRNALGVMDQRELVFPERARVRGAEGRGADGPVHGGVAEDRQGVGPLPGERRRPQRIRHPPDADERLAELWAQIPRPREGEEIAQMDQPLVAAGGRPRQGIDRGPVVRPRPNNGEGANENPDDPLAGRDLGRRELLAAAALRRQRRRELLQLRLLHDRGDGGVDGAEGGIGETYGGEEDGAQTPAQASQIAHPPQHGTDINEGNFRGNGQELPIRERPPVPVRELDDQHDEEEDEHDVDGMLEHMMRAQQQQEAEDEMLRHQEQEHEQEVDELMGAGPLGDRPERPQQGGENNDEFEPQFEPLDPVFDQEDPVDVEIHVALDELLGLRGPLGALIRNLLWLVAFNTTYLGLFAFIPHTIGSSVYSAVSNSTIVAAGAGLLAKNIPYAEWIVGNVSIANGNETVGIAGGLDFLSGMVRGLNEEGRKVNTLLRLPEVGTISLGYVSMALTVFALQVGVALYGRFHQRQDGARRDVQMAAPGGPAVDRAAGGLDDDFDERDFNRRLLRGWLQDDEDGDVGDGDGDGDGEGDEFEALNAPEFDEDEHDGEEGVQNPGDVRAEVGRRLNIGLKCAAAIVKVGVLLFLKMLLLPLLLGIWLDVATLPLFGDDTHERVLRAGRDLFGSVLLHWVVGITFMLLVTVSVLQLREVAHPELLARVIRPQEPQPDLLGNLLQEDGATHAKRMLLSLAIYAALLSVHVWLPARLLVWLGMGERLPFFRPKFWHLVLPQLQVPLELLIFHLSMLAFLEKYKNHIGDMQHRWLVFMCRLMGLTEHVLPREVANFELAGWKPVFLQPDGNEDYQHNDDAGPPFHSEEDAVTDATSASSAEEDGGKLLATEDSGIDKMTAKNGFGNGSRRDHFEVREIDPFWAQLLSLKDKVATTDNFIRENICPCSEDDPSVATKVGDTKPDGRRVLDESVSYIRLPEPSKASENSAQSDESASTEIADAGSNATVSSSSSGILLPTSIGSYRLRRRVRQHATTDVTSRMDAMAIEFWREVPGKPIVRPPEGWDDLGVGGAEVQGRWAWGNERMSEIEAGVARRTVFFPHGVGPDKWRCLAWWKVVIPLVLKIALLMVLSWLAVLVVVCVVASAPLSVGRGVFFLLRIPDRCVHDPMAFAVGGAIIFPCFCKLSQVFTSKGKGNGESSPGFFFRSWLTSFRPPPRGSDKLRVLFMAIFSWLVMAPLLLGMSYDLFLQLEVPSLSLSWGAGFMLLHLWAGLCYIGAFRKDFWVGIGAAGGNAAPDAAGVGAGIADAGEGGNDGFNGDQDPSDQDHGQGNTLRTRKRLKWQGNDGRIAALTDIIPAVAARWEWDKIDRVVLLEDCAYPVVRQLVVTFIGPVLLYLICSILLCVLSGGRSTAGIIFPFFKAVGKGRYHVFLFRSLSSAVIFSQLALAFQSPLKQWFKAAHKAARDDRYLVGEILLNYVAPPPDARVEGVKVKTR